MAHKFDVTERKNLNSEERKRLLSPEKTLSRLDLKKGGTMADIGCGTGLFTIPAAKLTLPDGKVYAIDISKEMLDEVASSAKAEGIDNIITVKSDEYDFKIASCAVDFVLLCTVLHEVDDKPRLLSEASRILRPGGKIAVIEFGENGEGFGPPQSHRLKKAGTAVFLEKIGFNNIASFDFGEMFYAVEAEKV